MSVEYCEECHAHIDTDFRFCKHMDRETIIKELEKQGVKITRDPDTVYIPENTEPSSDMEYLRDEHGWMIQTEIPYE